MKLKFRTRLLTSSLFVGAALASSPAYAQEAPVETPPEDVQIAPQEAVDEGAAAGGEEEVVVTGRLIRNPNIEASSPVSVIGEAEIELRQSNVAEQLLRELPGVAPSIGSSVNNGQGGSSFVDLRGLGLNRNLALIDGTRIVPARADGAPDLNVIPVALLERLDVLTGGASTTYGADAVSGVVNFVTKRNFAGAELEVSEQITERGDGNILRADLTLGADFNDGRGNAVISFGYQDAKPIYQGDRAFSRSSLSSATGLPSGSGTTVPTRLSIPNVGTRQFDPATGAFRTNASFDSFNFNPFNLLQTPFERYNIFGNARYEVTDGIEIYAQGIFSRNVVASIVAPSGTFGNPYTIPLSNPFLPTPARNQICAGIGLSQAQCDAAGQATSPTDPNYRTFTSAVLRRFTEAGVRSAEYSTDFFQQKAGIRGDITDTLDFDIYGTYGRSELLRKNIRYGLSSRVQQALLATNPSSCLDTSNSCVPLNLFGPEGSITPQMISFIFAADASDEQITELTQIRGVVSGDFGWTSPAADEPVGVAVGAEYRDQFAGRTPDNLSRIPGEVLGLGGAPQTTNNSTDVKEVFGEVIAPLVSDRPFFQSLTLEAGVRYSDYNTTGGALTYKVGGSWEPVQSLKIRGNYNRATRSPSIFELYASRNTGLNNLDADPCQGTAPVNNAALRAVCLAQGAPANTIGRIQPPSAAQINVTTVGEANLDVEKADTYTIGLVFQPDFVPGLAVTVDYYNIAIKDAITTPTIDDALRQCFGAAPFTNPTPGAETSEACLNIRRNPLTGGLDGSAATTPGIFLPLSNQGFILTDGIDLGVNYRRDLGFARLDLNFNGNWTSRSQFRSQPGSILRECVGFYSVNCGGPGNGTTQGGQVGSIQPEFSWNTRATLGFGAADISLLWRHISGVEVEPVVADNFLEEYRQIDAYDWFDLGARFEVTEAFALTVTVINLFDKKPPVVGSTIGSTAYNSGNTYPSTYDALGRRFAATARLKF